jgi:hypothetical protein
MGIQVTGIKAWLQRFSRMPSEIDKALLRQVEIEARPLVPDMRSTAGGYGAMPAKAAATARLSPLRDGAQVRAGGTGSVASEILYGAEHGGRKRGKRAVARRSKLGNVYITRRRTTMQFKPHMGQRGYWFWPTARKDLKGINRRMRDVLQRTVNDG